MVFVKGVRAYEKFDKSYTNAWMLKYFSFGATSFLEKGTFFFKHCFLLSKVTLPVAAKATSFCGDRILLIKLLKKKR